MLFVVVEAIQHLDNLKASRGGNDEDETEINTLEYVKESFEEKLVKVKTFLYIINAK